MIPIFSTTHSTGQSILTLEKEDEIKEDSPISVFAIAKKHNLKNIVIVDDDISGYWKMYKNSADLKIKVLYGIKLAVCNDLYDKSEESEKTESSVIILFKNSQSYYDFVPIYSLASTEGMLKHRRLDWTTLQTLWSPNLKLLIPFYSSFLTRNLMKYQQNALPDFGDLKPEFLIQEQGMPFDEMIKDATEAYAKSYSFKTIEAHQIYYYKTCDSDNHLTLRCICSEKDYRQKTWDVPNLNHFGSDEFSFEAYLNKTGGKL